MFSTGSTIGQKKFDLSLKGGSLEIGGVSLTGYQTQFDFAREEVRKGWWKYARQFGNPLDMRTHYEVTVPSDHTDGNIDLKIYAQSVDGAEGSIFNVGIESEKYKVQVEELLKEFKRHFYIQYYVEEIKLKDLEAAGLSRKYESAKLDEDKQTALNDLNAVQREVDRLRKVIKMIEGE